MKAILDKIQEYNKIIIIMHMRPDGDCYGSSFGLKQAILDNYGEKEIYVLGEQLENKKHIGITDTITDDMFKDALVFSLDSGTKRRVYDKRFETGDYLIRIDHHVHIEEFGDIDYVDTSCPATSFIIARLMKENNLIFSKKTAECLYTGIVTDTGRFRYRGVNGDTFRMLASLVETGINQQELLEKLYVRELNEIKFEGEFLNLIQREGNVIYAKVPKSLMDKHNITEVQVAEYINLLEDIKGYPIWVLFYEGERNIRCRVRSKTIPVDEIANKYKGGGHKFAAGAIFKTWEETQYIIEDLKRG